MANSKARLIFPPNYQMAGFTSAGISQFNDRDIPSAVRELVQNSLDAALGIGRRPAIVRFSVESHPLKRIPGLTEYKSAFESAESRHTKDKKGGLEADIIDDINEGLKAKTLPFLFVEDNGVGLDSRRMDALLGDGENIKDGENAIGCYGNGHWTVFELSRLRYILYGGVISNGLMTASGHAILASHKGPNDERLGKDGFYAVGLSDKDSESHNYPTDAKIPGMLKERLDNIRHDFSSDSGTVIAIPGFNYFGKDKTAPIAEAVKKVVALNFFPAIHRGDLEIHIREGDKKDTLKKANLPNYMASQGGDKARQKAGFPTGIKASTSYRTLTEGNAHLVSILGGNLRMFLRQGMEQKIATSRVTFCRNGMWVTDQVSMLANSYFTSKMPFDALLLADSGECQQFYNIMVRAEGRLHIDLKTNRLHKKEDKRALNKGFKAVREFLNKIVEDSEREEFEPSNFYQIETGQSVGGGKVPSAIRGEAKPVPGTAMHISTEKVQKKGEKKSAQQKRRAGTMMAVKTMAKWSSEATNTMQIGVNFEEDCDNCELQMALDDGTDPTCAGSFDKKRLYVHDAKVNGSSLQLVGGEEGKRVGVMLGSAKTGERRIVSVEFAGGQLRGSALETVHCDLYRRATKQRVDEQAGAT